MCTCLFPVYTCWSSNVSQCTSNPSFFHDIFLHLMTKFWMVYFVCYIPIATTWHPTPLYLFLYLVNEILYGIFCMYIVHSHQVHLCRVHWQLSPLHSPLQNFPLCFFSTKEIQIWPLPSSLLTLANFLSS